AGGAVHLPGSGDYRIQPVYIDDLMRCFVALSEAEGRLDATYDFIGEQIGFKAFIGKLLARVGATVRIESSPIEPFIREAVLTAEPSFSPDELAILVCDIVGPWTTDVAGARPRSVDEAIAAIVAELPKDFARPPDAPAPLAQGRRPG